MGEARPQGASFLLKKTKMTAKKCEGVPHFLLASHLSPKVTTQQGQIPVKDEEYRGDQSGEEEH